MNFRPVFSDCLLTLPRRVWYGRGKREIKTMEKFALTYLFFVLLFVLCIILLRWILGTAELIRQAKKQNEKLDKLIEIFSRLKVNGKKE
jgi:predicted permease